MHEAAQFAYPPSSSPASPMACPSLGELLNVYDVDDLRAGEWPRFLPRPAARCSSRRGGRPAAWRRCRRNKRQEARRGSISSPSLILWGGDGTRRRFHHS